MTLKYFFVTFFICIISGIAYGRSISNNDTNLHGYFDNAEEPYQNIDGTKESEIASVELSEPQDSITLQQALTLSLLHNPSLSTFSIEIRAREAQIIQAGLYPNPELSVDAEDFGGENGRQNFDGVETTIWLSQLIPLGGKVSKKKKVAVMEKDLSMWNYESKRLDLLTLTANTFIEALTAQERLHLAGELKKVAENVLETVSARVKAGKDFITEETKAEVALSISIIKYKKAERVLDAKRKNLALLWGDDNPGFKKLDGDLYAIKDIPSLQELQEKISQNPDLARWQHEIEMRSAIIKREDSKAIPDLTLNIGKRFFAEDSSDAFVMGFSLPLPLVDRNQGARLEAKHRLSKSKKDEEAVKLQILSYLSEYYQILVAAFIEIETLQNKVLPNARKVFENSEEWYRKGKFGYLQVLDAQRTLFQIREQFIDALNIYHQRVNDVERLIADNIN